MYESIFMGVQKKMKYWSKMPSRWVIDGGLKKFRYSSNNQNQMNAANIAALMMFLIIVSKAQKDEFNDELITNFTYKEFSESLGISRQSISMGLKVLESNNIISIKRIGRTNQYIVNQNEDKTWCKVPIHELEGIFCRSFSLRSQIELYALKLFIYFSAIRDKKFKYSMASYLKITEKTGIPKGFIKKTLSFMLVNELLSRVDRGHDNVNGEKVNLPNQYYLKNYNELVYPNR